MASQRGLLRVEMALGALGLTVALVVLVIAVDTVQYHAQALWNCVCHLQAQRFGPESLLAIGLGLLDGVVIARALASLWRQLRADRKFTRAFPVRKVLSLHGHAVHVFPGRPLDAFCAGLLRPVIYMSEATLEAVSPGELRAVLEHEAHHRARRDPLRLLLARVVSDAFRPLPPFATLAQRHAALADLAADAAAVRSMGDVTPLASALVSFDENPSHGTGVAPERVDHLVRDAAPETVSAWLLAATALAVGGIVSVAAPMLLLGWHPAPTLPVALELAAIVVATAPACLAARRAGACLRPIP